MFKVYINKTDVAMGCFGTTPDADNFIVETFVEYYKYWFGGKE